MFQCDLYSGNGTTNKAIIYQGVPTNFVRDCLCNVKKKSSKFRFLAITHKPQEVSSPKLAHAYVIVSTTCIIIYSYIHYSHLGIGQFKITNHDLGLYCEIHEK